MSKRSYHIANSKSIADFFKPRVSCNDNGNTDNLNASTDSPSVTNTEKNIRPGQVLFVLNMKRGQVDDLNTLNCNNCAHETRRPRSSSGRASKSYQCRRRRCQPGSLSRSRRGTAGYQHKWCYIWGTRGCSRSWVWSSLDTPGGVCQIACSPLGPGCRNSASLRNWDAPYCRFVWFVRKRAGKLHHPRDALVCRGWDAVVCRHTWRHSGCSLCVCMCVLKMRLCQNR